VNLRRRSLKKVYIARPAALKGSFGGVGWAYAPSHQSVMGCLQPQSGQLTDAKGGMLGKEKYALLLPLTCDVKQGDGIGFSENQCIFRVTHAARYPLHICLQLERLPP